MSSSSNAISQRTPVGKRKTDGRLVAGSRFDTGPRRELTRIFVATVMLLLSLCASRTNAVRANTVPLAESLKVIGDASPVPTVGTSESSIDLRDFQEGRPFWPELKLSISSLVEALHSTDSLVRLGAMDALADVGKDAVPLLIDALRGKETAYWACLVLNEIGPDAKMAVPALTRLLSDKQADIRREAILALASIGEASAPAVSRLAQCLDDKIDRTATTYALGRIGQAPPIAEEKIRQNAEGSEPLLKTMSLWTLARLHPDNDHFVRMASENLIQGLRSEDPQICAASADGLLMLGAAAIPTLIEGLEQEKCRTRLAYILGRFGPAAEASVDALAKLVDDENPETRQEAVIALGRIGPAGKAAVPVLVEALKNRDAAACYAVCFALGSIGPGAVQAEDTLVEALADEDETLAFFSALALARIAPDCAAISVKVVPVLREGLDNSDSLLRSEAVDALRRLGSGAAPSLPAGQLHQ